jgi:PncC family amidohydrolase
MVEGPLRELLSTTESLGGQAGPVSFTAFLTGESTIEDSLRQVVPGAVWSTRLLASGVLVTVTGAGDVSGVLERLRRERGSALIREGETEPAALLAAALRSRQLRLVTAESCTGGLVAKLMTDLPGSSEYFHGGAVVYSDAMKEGILGVPGKLISTEGAVSRAVVTAMASGALQRFGADCAIGISGIAGPSGGTRAKPVGTVWIAAEGPGGAWARRFLFTGDRDWVRKKSAVASLLMMEANVKGLDLARLPEEQS